MHVLGAINICAGVDIGVRLKRLCNECGEFFLSRNLALECLQHDCMC